jgi:hypothetical protein
MMTAERFYTCVEECLGGGCAVGELALDEARRTTHAVLTALGRQLSHTERLRLAAALPRRLAVELVAVRPLPANAAADDPVSLVAAELQIEPEVAHRRFACVLDTLRLAVGAALPPTLERIDAGGAGDLS